MRDPVRLVKDRNASFPIFVTPAPIVKDVIAVLENAPLPKEVTELGIMRDPVRL